MTAPSPRTLVTTFGLAAVLSLAACGPRSTSAGSVSVPPAATTTVATPGPATTAPSTAATGGATDQSIDQQIQNLSNSLNQVSGDLSNADKAAANGG